MKAIRKTPFALLLLAAILSACSGSAQDATPILKQVEQRYQHLDDFELKALVTSTMHSPARTDSIKMPISFIRQNPGKMRIEVDDPNMGMLLVSDGSTTWTYIPSMKQYTVEQATPVTNDADPATIQPKSNFTAMGEQLTKAYEDITDKMVSAKVLRTENYTLGGKTVPVNVVQVTYEKNPQMKQAKVDPTLYWITQDRHLVVRQEVNLSMNAPQYGGDVQMKQEMTLQKADLNPKISDNIFTFDVPDSAEKVDQFQGQEAQAPGANSGMEGKMAPDFTLPNLKGDKVTLSDLKGKIVLIDFWATWCAPCRRAHPHIQKIYDEYKDKGLVVLGINNEGAETARKYMEEHGYTFSTLIDMSDAVSARYGVSAIPSVFIIGRDGKVARHLVGFRPEESLRNALQQAGL